MITWSHTHRLCDQGFFPVQLGHTVLISVFAKF